jgi:hypothetical protein
MPACECLYEPRSVQLEVIYLFVDDLTAV